MGKAIVHRIFLASVFILFYCFSLNLACYADSAPNVFRAKMDFITVTKPKESYDYADNQIYSLSDGNFLYVSIGKKDVSFYLIDSKTKKFKLLKEYTLKNKEALSGKTYNFTPDKIHFYVSYWDNSNPSRQIYLTLIYDYKTNSIIEDDWKIPWNEPDQWEGYHDNTNYSGLYYAASNKNYTLAHNHKNLFLIDRKTQLRTHVGIPLSGKLSAKTSYAFANALDAVIPIGIGSPWETPYSSVKNLGENDFLVDYSTGYLVVDSVNKKFTNYKLQEKFYWEVCNTNDYVFLVTSNLAGIYIYDKKAHKLYRGPAFNYYTVTKKDFRVVQNNNKVLFMYKNDCNVGASNYLEQLVFELLDF